MNNRGQFNNYGVILIALFAFSIITMFSYLILGSFITVFASTSLWSTILQTTATRFLWVLQSFDWIIVIMMVSFLISLALTSWKINTSKAFFIVSFVLAAFFGFIGYIFSFAFGSFVTTPIFATVTPYFPNTLIVCTNLHWVSMAAYVVGSIALYAKKEVGGEFVPQ